jgi:hypothetical protein
MRQKITVLVHPVEPIFWHEYRVRLKGSQDRSRFCGSIRSRRPPGSSTLSRTDGNAGLAK